ncbi:hypothetical protein AVEN_163306-1 [Araneus ventricosus]|uniref:Smr domain-containing protein n=1 Tax=Araneus ventricosus TaxID=182803 RepID=A0A4Y2N4L0_ARAVE|nr:hypothetical protein AVEN_163306-1 [Araneus ventricosus]
MEEANRRACNLILKRNIGRGSNTLDLHSLYAHEAVEAMQGFIETQQKMCILITGQGRHSMNGAKVRPAVVNYLKNHKFNLSDGDASQVKVYLHSERNAPRDVS